MKILLALLLAATTCDAASVQLQWDANTESDMAGYKCYYRERGTRAFTHYTTVTSTTCTVNNLTQGAIYIFTVTAFNNMSTESGYSNRVGVNTPTAKQTYIQR